MGEVVAKQQNQIVSMNEFADIAADFHVDKSDILIPKILLMQPSSDMVNEEKASLGDFRNSVTGAKVGSIAEPFSFIPFMYKKTWDIVNADDNNTWVRSEPFNPEDENLPWEFVENAVNMKRIKRLDFYGFEPKSLEQGNILPMVLSFKSTGYREGMKILTQFQINVSTKRLPWSHVYSIAGSKLKNEKNQTYCVPKVDIAGETNEENLKLCYEWYKNMKTLSVRVDESDNQGPETVINQEDVIDNTGKF